MYPSLSDVSSDAGWETFIENTIATEYHPTGSCAMMPQEKGGVSKGCAYSVAQYLKGYALGCGH